MPSTIDVTFCADATLLEAARTRARAEHISLDEAFRRWLEDYAGREAQAERALQTIRHIRGKVDSGGRRFTREEMNER